MAITDPEKRARGGMSASLVDRDTPGFHVFRQIAMLGGEFTYEVVLEDCRVAGWKLLGNEGQGFGPMQIRLGTRRMEMAAWCIGAAQRALDMMREYAPQRTTVQIGQAFNAVIATPPLTQNLLRIALIIAFTQIGRGLLQLARNFSAEMISQRMERDIREELYISLLGKSMTFHSLQPIGDTMVRATNDVREVNFLFNPGINLVLGSFMFLIIPLIAAPRYHPSLILVPALYMVGYVLALWQYLKELRPVTNEVDPLSAF